MEGRSGASMFLKQAILFAIGSSAGGVIAAGVFAFLAAIGVFPRLIAYTDDRAHILLCETMMILGGVFGCFVDLYHMPRLFGGLVFLTLWGGITGIFVGALVMSLAETLKALPVFSRRTSFAVGIQYVITALALGKSVGALVYFWNGFGS